MKIIIAGYGFVGKAVLNTLKHHHNCVVVDPIYTSNSIEHHLDADCIIVCVGTPTLENGGCDISAVDNVLSQVPDSMPVLIKSTIIPDAFEELLRLYSHLNVCHSPEFLRAKSADYDFANQTFMVIGGDDKEDFWQVLFAPALTKCKMYFRCSITEAAMVKYTANAFLATKLSFFNNIYDLCQENGSDYDIVRQIITYDSRIGASHTLVPGVDGERGFGGHCFPKDTKALAKYAAGLNTPLEILETAVKYNKKVRKSLDI
jgi:UDPglucose 6-dehydrogenase